MCESNSFPIEAGYSFLIIMKFVLYVGIEILVGQK